jgi:hypothetical protein
MKKRIIIFLVLLTIAGFVYADTSTPNLGLTKPTAPAGTWGEKLNINFDLLDSAIGAAQGGLAHLGANQTFTGSNTFSGALIPPSAFFNSLSFLANSLCSNGETFLKAAGVWTCGASVGTHNLLSATHPDTTAGAVARGDIITGQGVSPTWTRKALGAAGTFLRSDGTDLLYAALLDADVPDTITLDNLTQVTTRSHASLQNLSADDHTIYALLAGRSGGQTLTGGTAASENLTVQSTANATKGGIRFGTSEYNEATNRLCVNTTGCTEKLTIVGGNILLDNNTTIKFKNSVGSPAAFLTMNSGDAIILGDAAFLNQAIIRWGGDIRFDVGQGGSNIEVMRVSSTNGPGPYGVGIFNTAPATVLHLGLNGSGIGAITIEESTATPSNPTSGSQLRSYMKADKFVIQYNDAGTVRYKYLDLTGTGITWVHTTTAP